jgi:hypothetical protein
MKPSEWGPPIWRLYHILAANIREDRYNALKGDIFLFIKRISAVLPCPDCSAHATAFLKRVSNEQIKTKQGLIDLLYFFHNTVNKRTHKKIYNQSDLNIYQYKNLIQSYNIFIQYYKTTGNLNLIAESFQRTIVVNDFKKWIMTHYKSFIMPRIEHIPSVISETHAELPQQPDQGPDPAPEAIVEPTPML